MLDELNAITKELDQFRKSTNTKMSYPKVIKDKVVALPQSIRSLFTVNKAE